MNQYITLMIPNSLVLITDEFESQNAFIFYLNDFENVRMKRWDWKSWRKNSTTRCKFDNGNPLCLSFFSNMQNEILWWKFSIGFFIDGTQERPFDYTFHSSSWNSRNTKKKTIDSFIQQYSNICNSESLATVLLFLLKGLTTTKLWLEVSKQIVITI